MTEDIVAEARAYVAAYPDAPFSTILHRYIVALLAALNEREAETIARLRDTIHGQGLSMQAMTKEAQEHEAEIARLKTRLLMTDRATRSEISAAEWAVIIFDEFKKNSPVALVSGNPATRGNTLIDGSFDLLEIARQIICRQFYR